MQKAFHFRFFTLAAECVSERSNHQDRDFLKTQPCFLPRGCCPDGGRDLEARRAHGVPPAILRGAEGHHAGAVACEHGFPANI